MTALSEECRRLDALAQAEAGAAPPVPVVAAPTVSVPSSPLRAAAVPPVTVSPVPPVMDPEQAASTLARAQRFFASLSGVQEAAALLAIGNPARMEQVLSEIAAAVRS